MKPPSHPSIRRVAVIGAGAAGLAAAKSLLEEGLQPVIFESSANAGGVWDFRDTHSGGGGPAYRSLHTNTSSRMMAFSDFPFPTTAPNFPSRQDVHQYLNDYAAHFGVRRLIRFNTCVEQITPLPAGGWKVLTRFRDGVTKEESFDAVMVCSGYYSHASIPSIPGIDCFRGRVMHSSEYRDSDGFEGKRVVIVGVGSSGADIAVELSRVAAQVTLVARPGVWFLPHCISGKPYDYQITRFSGSVPLPIQNLLFRQKVLGAYRREKVESVLQKIAPARFDLLRSRLTPASQILGLIAAGSLSLHSGIQSLDEELVAFSDGSRSPADVLIFCTGYRLQFPFFPSGFLEVSEDAVYLYKHVFQPDYPDLAFIGMCVVVGPIFPVIEMQARWAARVFSGQAVLPLKNVMQSEIDARKRNLAHLGLHPMRVLMLEYLDNLAGEIGVKPRLLYHPMLLRRLLFGPLVAAQYRLDGPGKSVQADWWIRSGR